MKLRLGTGSGGGERAYAKLGSYGYQCVDFQMANTESEWYSFSSTVFEKYLKREKAWADEYGIEGAGNQTSRSTVRGINTIAS